MDSVVEILPSLTHLPIIFNVKLVFSLSPVQIDWHRNNYPDLMNESGGGAARILGPASIRSFDEG